MWKDATNYRQGQRSKDNQTAWKTHIDDVRIWVSKGHINYPGYWIMSCPDLRIDCVQLGDIESLSSEQARDRAIEYAWEQAVRMKAKFEGLADRLYATPNLDS